MPSGSVLDQANGVLRRFVACYAGNLPATNMTDTDRISLVERIAQAVEQRLTTRLGQILGTAQQSNASPPSQRAFSFA